MVCSEKWLHSSNFSARGTIQFYYQKCFSVVCDRFHIAGLLRKTFSKNRLGPHGSTLMRIIPKIESSCITLIRIALQPPSERCTPSFVEHWPILESKRFDQVLVTETIQIYNGNSLSKDYRCTFSRERNKVTQNQLNTHSTIFCVTSDLQKN